MSRPNRHVFFARSVNTVPSGSSTIPRGFRGFFVPTPGGFAELAAFVVALRLAPFEGAELMFNVINIE